MDVVILQTLWSRLVKLTNPRVQFTPVFFIHDHQDVAIFLSETRFCLLLDFRVGYGQPWRVSRNESKLTVKETGDGFSGRGHCLSVNGFWCYISVEISALGLSAASLFNCFILPPLSSYDLCLCVAHVSLEFR